MTSVKPNDIVKDRRREVYIYTSRILLIQFSCRSLFSHSRHYSQNKRVRLENVKRDNVVDSRRLMLKNPDVNVQIKCVLFYGLFLKCQVRRQRRVAKSSDLTHVSRLVWFDLGHWLQQQVRRRRYVRAGTERERGGGGNEEEVERLEAKRKKESMTKKTHTKKLVSCI